MVYRFVFVVFLTTYCSIAYGMEEKITAEAIVKNMRAVEWQNNKRRQADFVQQQQNIIELIKQFLKQGNDVNKIYNVPQSSLDCILERQETETLLSESLSLPLVVEYLIKNAKANVNLKTSGYSPLGHALGSAVVTLASAVSHHDCKETAMILLSHQKIDVNIASDRYETTPLHTACQAHKMKGSSDFTKIIKLLIAKGAELEVKDMYENTPGDDFRKYTDNYRSLDELIAGLILVNDEENNTVKVEFDDKDSEAIDFDMLNCAPDKPEETSVWTIGREKTNKVDFLEFVVCQKD